MSPNWCLNYDTGEYEWIDESGFSLETGEYVWFYDDDSDEDDE